MLHRGVNVVRTASYRCAMATRQFDDPGRIRRAHPVAGHARSDRGPRILIVPWSPAYVSGRGVCGSRPSRRTTPPAEPPDRPPDRSAWRSSTAPGTCGRWIGTADRSPRTATRHHVHLPGLALMGPGSRPRSQRRRDRPRRLAVVGGGANAPTRPSSIAAPRARRSIYWAPDSRSIAFLTTETDGSACGSPCRRERAGHVDPKRLTAVLTWPEPTKLMVHSGVPRSSASRTDGTSVEPRPLAAGGFRAPAVTGDGQYWPTWFPVPTFERSSPRPRRLDDRRSACSARLPSASARPALTWAFIAPVSAAARPRACRSVRCA